MVPLAVVSVTIPLSLTKRLDNRYPLALWYQAMIAKFGEQVVDAKVWAPAKRVGVHEAKTRLSELLRLVYGGQRLRLPAAASR